MVAKAMVDQEDIQEADIQVEVTQVEDTLVEDINQVLDRFHRKAEHHGYGEVVNNHMDHQQDSNQSLGCHGVLG